MNTGAGAKVAENQQNVRAAERFDLEVKVDLESDHNFYTGLTQNISSGGVFIATHHHAQDRRSHHAEVLAAGLAETLAVETEVRWIRENTRAAHASTARPAWASASSTSRPKPPPRSRQFVESRESLYYDDE